jgi:hypothetical protein
VSSAGACSARDRSYVQGMCMRVSVCVPLW